MKNLIFLITFLLSSLYIFAQNTKEDFIKKGIEYHDTGKFEEAITSYKKALALDPKSALIHYEISLSYFSKQDYKEAIKYADFVLKQKNQYMLQAYLTKGSALDMLGETKKSIKLFKKAIKKEEKHFLLFYNLGINYFKIGELENAEENFIAAIHQNPNHASSHFMLATIHNQKGDSVQTLLASHYFLFLEPDTKRAEEAYEMLQKYFSGNVSKDASKPNTINIMLAANSNDQFGAVELMVSLLQASNSLEENKDKTADELFIENTKSFFTILGELKEEKNKDIWWDFYTPFFYDLSKTTHLETYCNYIKQNTDEKYMNWLAENENKLILFDAWLKDQQK